MTLLNRIDSIVLRRVLARVGTVVVVFLGLMILVESLNTSRFATLSAVGGLPLAVLGMVVPAIRWSIGSLPITVLIGTMAAVLDLQGRQELTILKAVGYSLWRLIRVPVAVLFVLTAGASLLGESWTVSTDRSLSGGTSRSTRDIWLEQTGSSGPYILHADRARATAPPHLEGVRIFETSASPRAQYVAATAVLSLGHWTLSDGAIHRPDRAPEPFSSLDISTTTTLADLDLAVSKARDLTVAELLSAAVADVTSPELRAVSLTSLYRAFALPVMVVGAMLVAFALTARYRRRANYGGAMMQGLVVGFVLFTLNEMAIRAGNAQVITPLAATGGPAVVAVLVGLTALLFLEDGYV